MLGLKIINSTVIDDSGSDRHTGEVDIFDGRIIAAG